jgi:three-Cys-motif partner protein
MTDHDDHFGEFEPHTLLKHAVLYNYLQEWAMKLLQSSQWPVPRVWFIDGFAGAGRDGKGNPGSPVIACEVAAQVRERLLNPPRSLGVFAIEIDARIFEKMESNLQPYRAADPSAIVTRRGAFADHCPNAIATVAGAPALAFLDPFGVKGLRVELYAPLLASRGSEIFMLVADAGAGRLGGVLNADDRRFDRLSDTIRSAPSLFPDYDAAALQENETKRVAYLKHIEDTKRGSLAALADAFGTELARELESSPANDVSEVLLTKLREVMVSAGARHITTFPVRDIDGVHKYTLLHATAKPAGVLAMKAAINRSLGKESLPGVMLDRLRADLSTDVTALVDAIKPIYQGRTVPLNRGERGSLQDELIVATRLYPHQLPELKMELKLRGWLAEASDGKPAVTFPPAT